MIPQLSSHQPDQLFWTSFASTLIAGRSAIHSDLPDVSCPSSLNEMLSHVITAAIDSFQALHVEDVDFLIEVAKIRGAAFVRDE
jgi:hypothetical protein